MADYAQLVFEIDSSQAAGAAKALLGLERASASAANAAAKLQNVQRGADGRFKSNAAFAAENKRELSDLARQYNPLMAANIAYAHEVERTSVAVRSGIISEQRRADILAQTRVRLDAAAQAAHNYATGMGGVNNVQASVGNQFAQLNDVVVTAWGGMNPALIGMQQGMQMVQGFAGQSLPQAIGTLRGAFAQLLSPLTLVTIGGVAAAAALIQLGTSFFSSGGDAVSFEERVSAAESAIERLNKTSQSLSRAGLEDLREKYGQVTAEIRALVEAERLLGLAETAKEINAVTAALTESLGVGTFNTAYGELARVFEVSANEAQVLYGRLDDIRKLDTAEKQLAAITRLRDSLSSVTDGFTNMTDEQSNMLSLLVKAGSLIEQQQNAIRKTPEQINAAANATRAWESAMAGVLSYIDAVGRSLNSISGGAIQLAAIRTETELLRKGVSIRDASYEVAVKTAKVEGEQRTRALEAQFGWAGKILGIAEKNQSLSIISAQKELDIERDAAREREKTNKGAGGKAAAELKAAEKGFQSLRELMERDSLFQTAEYEKRQAQLDVALAKKLISEQNYQEMRAQLQMMYFGTEYQLNAVNYGLDLEQLNQAFAAKLLSEEQYLMKRRQLQWDYMAQSDSTNANLLSQELSNWGAHFGQMNQLAGGGYDTLLRLQRSFAAASALINTWKAYTDVLASGEVMSPWAKLAWGGKILAAGLGAVNAIKGGGGGSSAASSAAAARQEPTRNILINLKDMGLGSRDAALVESVIQQIFEQSKDGRVIIARDN